jgi:hypothetical protein
LDSLIGTFLLVVNPVFFVLTFTFMTDVPFVSLANVAFFCLVAGLTRVRGSSFWVGTLAMVCALFTRLIAVAIPVALAASVLLVSRARVRSWLLAPALALLTATVIPMWIGQVWGLPRESLKHLDNIRDYWRYLGPTNYAASAVSLPLVVGLWLSPLTVGSLASLGRRRLLWGAILALVVLEAGVYVLSGRAPVALGSFESPQTNGWTWTLSELGMARSLLRGEVSSSILAPWLSYPVTLVGLLSAAVIAVRLVDMARSGKRPAELLFLLYIACQVGLAMLLWLFHDRYYLAVLPPLVVVVVRAAPPGPRSAMAGIVALLLISLTGTWDSLQMTRATEAGLSWLREQDAALADIDAGYALSGWYLYAHPENLAAGASPDSSVQWITARYRPKPYVIAASPMPGYRILREIVWSPSFWAATDRIYVLANG